MITPYVTTLIVVLARAFAFADDDRCPPGRLLAIAFLSTVAVLICFQIDFAFWTALSCVLTTTLLPLLTERVRSRVTWRLVLSLTIAVPLLLPDLAPHGREGWDAAWLWIRTEPVGSELFAKINPRFVVVHVAGLILCTSECNLLLRVLLRLLGISPPGSHSPPATETSPAPDRSPANPARYLRGALVGAIERVLIYIFAANGAFNAIAFVITVKGIVRYQEIVEHHSAEYILVGTLLSTLMAMLLGMLLVHAA